MTFQLDAPLGYLSSNPDPSTKGTFTIPDGSTMGSISIVSYLRTFLVSALVCLVALKLGVPFVHGSGSLPVVGVAGLSIEFLLILFLVYRPRSLSVWGAGALFFLGTIVVNSLVPDFDCKCLGPIPVPRSIRVLLAGVLTVHFVIGFFLVKRWVSRKSEQSMRIRKMESLAGACMAILALCLVLILSDSDGKQDSHSVRVSNSNEPTQRSSVPPVRGGDVNWIFKSTKLDWSIPEALTCIPPSWLKANRNSPIRLIHKTLMMKMQGRR